MKTKMTRAELFSVCMGHAKFLHYGLKKTITFRNVLASLDEVNPHLALGIRPARYAAMVVQAYNYATAGYPTPEGTEF